MGVYTVDAMVPLPNGPGAYEPVGRFGSHEDALADAQRAVRGMGYLKAAVTAPDGNRQEFQRPALRPTGTVVIVKVRHRWMVYSESAPSDLLEVTPDVTVWERHTAKPVDAGEMDLIRNRLKEEIAWWDGYFTETFHEDPGGALPEWAQGKIIAGDIEEVPAATGHLPTANPASPAAAG